MAPNAGEDEGKQEAWSTAGGTHNGTAAREDGLALPYEATPTLITRPSNYPSW